MQRLLNPGAVVVPMDNENRYFRYTDPDTGYCSHASIYEDWVEKARKHRTANGLPIPADFEAQMENQLCAQLPPEWCERTGQSWVSTRFGLDDFKNGMKAFGSLMANRFKFVSRTESDRRARICSNCYLNVNIPGCTTCQKLASFITGAVANLSTSYDDRLKACAICHCANKAQVHFTMSDLDTTDTAEKQALYPPFCWKKRDGENYLPLAA